MWVIKAAGHMPIIPRKQVGVYIKRDADTSVAELLLHIFWLCALLNQERGEGVAQVMEPDTAQSSGPQADMERGPK